MTEVARVADVSPAIVLAFTDRTERWFTLLGDELAEVPVALCPALAGNPDPLLAKSVAIPIHAATFSALKSTGMSVAP